MSCVRDKFEIIKVSDFINQVRDNLTSTLFMDAYRQEMILVGIDRVCIELDDPIALIYRNMALFVHESSFLVLNLKTNKIEGTTEDQIKADYREISLID